MNPSLGKLFILMGVLLIGVGVLIIWSGHIPWLGRLPGDISIKRDNFQFYFPITTSLIISALLSIIFYIFRR